MNNKQKNTLLAVAIVLGLASLPTTWMTISNPQIELPTGDSFGLPMAASMFEGMSIAVTGLNGSATLLSVSIPLWVIAILAIAASGLQLMRSTQQFEIPEFVIWAIAIFALVWMIVPVLMGLTGGNITPGIGWLLAVASGVAPIIGLLSKDAKTTVPTSDSE